jgi:hypothetical protein
MGDNLTAEFKIVFEGDYLIGCFFSLNKHNIICTQNRYHALSIITYASVP